MSSFRKVPLTNKQVNKRVKINKITSEVVKRSKKPGIQALNDIEIDPAVKQAISKLLPKIEIINKTSLDKNVKAALVAELVNNADLGSFHNVPPPQTPKPRYSSTPARRTPHVLDKEDTFKYSGEENELLPYLSKFYNSKYEVIDKQGDGYPGSDINRVLSYIGKSDIVSGRRGPVGTPQVLDNIAELGYKMEKIGSYIRNQNAIERLLNTKKRLEDRELANLRKQKKNRPQLGSGWTSIGIRY